MDDVEELIAELKKNLGEDSTIILSGCNGVIGGAVVVNRREYDELVMLVGSLILVCEEEVGKNRHMIMEDVSRFLSTHKENRT